MMQMTCQEPQMGERDRGTWRRCCRVVGVSAGWRCWTLLGSVVGGLVASRYQRLGSSTQRWAEPSARKLLSKSTIAPFSITKSQVRGLSVVRKPHYSASSPCTRASALAARSSAPLLSPHIPRWWPSADSTSHGVSRMRVIGPVGRSGDRYQPSSSHLTRSTTAAAAKTRFHARASGPAAAAPSCHPSGSQVRSAPSRSSPPPRPAHRRPESRSVRIDLWLRRAGPPTPDDPG